jgi:cysteine-rich repeat protein
MTCTIDDMCVSGECTGDPMTCGDGVVQGSCGEECDDGNTTNLDGCSATCQTELVCLSAPATGCRVPIQPGKSSVQYKNGSPDTKDKLVWKWTKGAATTKAEFGTPLTTTDYLLCVYDNGTLVSTASIPADQLCAGRPCWKETGKGFKYKDKDATPDGITNLTLKEGEAGKAKIILKGKGANINLPTLPMTQPVLVQLRNSASSVCWEATFGAPPTKNDATQYKDKSN